MASINRCQLSSSTPSCLVPCRISFLRFSIPIASYRNYARPSQGCQAAECDRLLKLGTGNLVRYRVSPSRVPIPLN
jgi:hypothetical protein